MNDFESINPAPVQINIGDFCIFCDYIRISGNSVITEQPNVSGGNSVTNTGIKNTSVTVNGRLACDSDFRSFIIYAENILRNKIHSDFQYKNIFFNHCILKSYSAENKNGGITDTKLIFSVSDISEAV